MGIVGVHPAVFVKVANTGLVGYGTWKSVRKMEDRQRVEGIMRKTFGLKDGHAPRCFL
jgi:hypothetical protein